MARLHRWVAAVCLLTLICHSQSQPPKVNPNLQEIFNHYSSGGSFLTQTDVRDMIVSKYGDYVQYMNLDLEKELMQYADDNDDNRLDVSEMQKLVEYITRRRH